MRVGVLGVMGGMKCFGFKGDDGDTVTEALHRNFRKWHAAGKFRQHCWLFSLYLNFSQPL